ncbi:MULTISPECIES: PleD family two-component system response regulator [unclassified Oceanispirochaeta]|uniref:response regulator n=1 Tax=unclassified Oceanispirochaeta TaxID=2635722 RepID=UPI000E095144|nr:MULTISPECIES: response regulator [unclassified Oceanispirochaeta]MBF9014676.1 response regulator [Oceanispirochaeta sp. M2]NPD70932.1 response regulator [Oceanispirochaeta sp. M1]RDG33766.1 response regulator [Oceanispirochaeta sp. M1]
MILVVDDTPANIDIIIEILGDIDEVAVALDGEDALDILSEESPDLVLLDIMMPGIDGYEVCRRMKENPDWKNIPVIFLSGNDQAAEKEKGMALGAVDYLIKPIDPALVIEKVKTYLPS